MRRGLIVGLVGLVGFVVSLTPVEGVGLAGFVLVFVG